MPLVASAAGLPSSLLPIAGFALIGLLLGCCTGLVPGLHVNNVALGLAAAAPALTARYPLRAVGAAMVAAAIAHSFLDVVPSVALGVPDGAMALSALPGHRLVLDGRGREAIAISAAGSLFALVVGLALAVPLTSAVAAIYPALERRMALVLVAVAGYLVWTEGSAVEPVVPRLLAIATLALSGALGWLVLDVAGGDGLLAPLFAGLFGVPLLASSVRGGGDLPPQPDAAIRMPRRRLAVHAAGGGVAGALVGWLPGVSPAAASSVVQGALPRSESEMDAARAFVASVSGVNTSNAVYALLALYAVGRERSGVAVALADVAPPTAGDVVVYLGVAAGAALLAYGATRFAGRWVFAAVDAVDYRFAGLAVLGLLAALSVATGGVLGMPVLLTSAAVGWLPHRTGVRRVHCMGCVLVPVALFYLG